MSTNSVHSSAPLQVDQVGQVDEVLEEALPLSPAQRRLWFVQGLDPSSSAYTIPFAFDLRGPLDAGLLERALYEVVARHESLRTVFDQVDDEPMQIFRPEPDVPFEVEDLSGAGAAEREAAVRAALEHEAVRTFDLGRGPLLVSRLLRLAEDEHLWLLTVHHIVFDGSSLPVLIEEVGAVYRSLRAGRTPELPELPLQYADFAAWFDEEVAEPRRERDGEFWRAELDGYPTVLRLPLDRPRPRCQTFRGELVRAPLEPGLARAVRELGRSAGATEFMTYLALWQALIARLTGLDRLLVGVPISGRDRSETEGLIGMLINTLVLRADVEGDPTVRELLARARAVCLGAFAHQDLPFEQLVEELKPERHSSFSPLTQVGFTLDSFSDLPSDLVPGITLSCREFQLKSSKVDLTLMVRTSGEGTNCLLEYNTDLFEPATARRWLDAYLRMLRAVVEAPEARLSELPVLGPAELALVTREWAAVSAPYPSEAGLDELFAAQVAARPDAVALTAPSSMDLSGVDPAEHVTFAELDRRAEAIADLLEARGVGRGEPVALLLERSPELIAVVLGIVRAGAAYVPLDPAYPRERLRSMLEDAGVRILVTRSGLSPRISGASLADLGVDLLLLDGSGEPHGEARPAGTPRSRVATGGDDLAYVIYTSGSTGRPKGVEVVHRGVVRLVMSNDHTTVGPDRSLLHLSSVSFDAATLEMWGPLLTGGRMVLQPAGASSPEEIAGVLGRQRVT
ncbi:MAG: condensation domain-containing protein, partial [Acidobacteriota bacterium]